MINDYDQIKQIGRGSFSKVYSAIHKITKESVAIKRIPLHIFNKFKERMLAELEIIKKLKHENVLKFYEIYQSKNNIYILSELCEGGTLMNIMDDIMSEQKIWEIYKQIISGIKYLYEHKIFHRDIKPENILLKDNVVKIADFGFAKEIDDYNVMMDTICGSPLYMAPEIVLSRPTDKEQHKESTGPYNTKSDVWSLGIILYQMMYNKHPYGNVKNIIQLIDNYKHKTKISFNNDKYSKELIDLVSKMLEYDPENRLEWNKLFNHEWLNNKFIIAIDNSIINSSVDDYDSEEENSITDSYQSFASDKDELNASENNNFVPIRSQPIKINKTTNDSDIIYPKSPFSIPKTGSLKLHISQKEIDVNEDYFGDSCIEPLEANVKMSTENIDGNNIRSRSHTEVSDSNIAQPWSFIKKSLKFFSL